MKRKHLSKKIGSLVLAAAMMMTSFPVFGTEARAVSEASEPSRFATKEQLKDFDTDDTDGANTAKVYFGNNNQEWWIAGCQDKSADSVTLFAASPLINGLKFDSAYKNADSSTHTKSYSDEWGCTYSEGTAIETVDSNHYGASSLRTTLKSLETSYFSTAEQSLMKKTTVLTNDRHNSMNDVKTNCAYSTTDKLYLAYGDTASGKDDYITVGKNQLVSDDLNNGLRIDKTYWGSKIFWLRARPAIFMELMRGWQFRALGCITRLSELRMRWCPLLKWICHQSSSHLLRKQHHRKLP